MNRIQIQNLSKSNNSIRELKQGDHELSNIRGGSIALAAAIAEAYLQAYVY